jgi:hypothetical protein
MSLKLSVVDTNYVNQTWPFVEKYINDALTSSPDFPDWAANYTTEHVRSFLTAGNWLLVVAVDEQLNVHGACTVSFINYPLHRVAFITSIGGKLVSSKDTFEQLKRILQAYGATKIQGYGRESIVRLWRRLFGFEARNTLVEVLL